MKSKQLFASTIQILAAVTAFAGIVFLMWISVYSADDFWYSTFLDGGLASFLELTKYHYEIFNGRVLVHLAAQLILHLGNWAFSLVGLLCCAAIPLAALRAAQRPRSQAAACLAVFGVGVLVLPRELLVEGLFWRSAFCNYVLPTAMVAGELLVLMRVTGPGKTRFGAFPACVLAGLLCGATTEQSGLVAMAAAGLVGLWCLVKNRRKLAYPAVALLCSAAGLMTVFLSPATYSRFFRETKAAKLSSFFDSLQSGLESQAALFAAGRTASILLALLFLFTALALMRITEKRELPLAAGGLSMAAALLSPFLPKGVQTACYALLLALLLLWAVALTSVSRCVEGLLLLLTLASVLVMLPTKSLSARVLLPAFLYALAAAALLLSGELSAMKPIVQTAALPAAVFGVFLFRLPFFSGCWGNYVTDRLNASAADEAHETGVLYYCLDYDMDCTYTKPFDDGYYYNTYLESEGLAPDTTVYFYGEGRPVIYVNGERISSPAFPDGEGGWMLPLRDIVEPMGGSVELRATGVIVHFPDREVVVTYMLSHEAQIAWTDADGSSRKLDVPKPEHYFEMLIGERAYTEAFGLTVSSSSDGMRLDVTAPD